MSTIPARAIINVSPSVLAAGGQALNLLGLFLTTSTRIPIGTVQAFSTSDDADDFFGATSPEAILIAGYFLGYDNSVKKAGSILVAQYPLAAVFAYLRGGDVSALTLTQLQAITGSLSVTIDGVVKSGTPNLAAATSFSNAAAILVTALSITGVTKGVVTGSLGASFTGTGSGANLTVTSVTGVIHPGDAVTGTGVPALTTILSQTSGTTGGAGVYVTSAVTTSSGASLTTTSTTLEVTGVSSGALDVNEIITGSGIASGTYITALGTGTGGIGTYIVTSAQNVASTSITAKVPGVVYDSVSGAFVVNSGTAGVASTITFATGTTSTALKLTSATGAVLSQGANAAVPSAFMDSIVELTQNWASFFLDFDPDGGSGNAQKLLFADWANGTDDRYAYIAQDTDVTAATTSPATSSLGYLIGQANLSGTALIYTPTDSANPVGAIAAFISGSIASIAFDQANQRTTMAFRSQGGLLADVTTETASANLIANGYNFYGAYGTANDQFVFFYPGSISGDFEWIDSYVNEIWLTNEFQLALMVLETESTSIPYTSSGYASIETALQAPIEAGVSFGAIRAGVELSSSQITAVNNSAGANVAPVIQQRGWYLQITPASAAVRQARQSPPMKFFYTDGQSIQEMDLSAIEIQ